MIEEMTHRLVRLIRGALLPTTLPQAELNLYGGWETKTELTGAWLTQIIHTVRCPRSVQTCVALIMRPSNMVTYSSNPPNTSPIQGLSRGSVCSGDPKWFAAGDSRPAPGVESSLPHGDSAAHYRWWGMTLFTGSLIEGKTSGLY